MSEIAAKLGIQIPEILLPGDQVELSQWAVVACDQYTSQPNYWEEINKNIGDKPSTLKLIYPEVYLEEENGSQRISKINSTMQEYLDQNILKAHGPCFIYIDRKTSHAASRKGLILAVDLEKYDYNKGSQTLIRATEGTVLDRLPPRIRIREHAPIELPHIMLLIDDPGHTVIEPLSSRTKELKKLYDFDLMMGGGHITGYSIDHPEWIHEILEGLQKLSTPSTFRAKYQVGEDKGVLLFAAGDGNHSLASAKGHWENIKKTLQENELDTHPARYALVEIVNVHDEGLQFEPIHRVLFNVDSKALLTSMSEFFKDCHVTLCRFDSKEQMQQEIKNLENDSSHHRLPYVSASGYGVISVQNPKCNLAVGTLQNFLDSYIEKNPLIKIDYIHGDEVVTELGSQEGNMGFYLPSMDKNDLFKTVILDGVLPRKTFSMGEADEKRFYLECRKIK